MRKRHIHTTSSQSGNVLFIILIAVALFAALSYAVTQSSRSGSGDVSEEKAKLDQAVVDNYTSCLNQGTMKLEIVRQCSAINYDPPSEWGSENKDCHMFHPEGGGCSYLDLSATCPDADDLLSLSIGEQCGLIVYAGESGGNRIYTTTTDQTSTTWNNGTTSWTVTGATSTSDGFVNTNILVALSDAGAPYQAANICRALGEDWYLPAQDELDLLYDNQAEGALSSTFDISGTFYYTSSEYNNNTVWRQSFSDGSQINSYGKPITRAVRCARRD